MMIGCRPMQFEGLLDHELEVLHAVGAGRTTRQIAADLGITIGAVEARIRAANRKLGAMTRIQAAASISVRDGRSPNPEPPVLDELQLDLLALRAHGMTVAAAARELNVSRRTAWRRLAEARAALGVATNTEAVVSVPDPAVSGHVWRLAS